MAAEGVERRDGRLLVIENSFDTLGTGVSGRLFFFVDASSEEAITENATGAF
jgi:hypothetical protein